MKKLFNKILGLFKLEKEPEKIKSKDGQRLTQWEKNFIWKSLQKDGRIICTNCESAYMYEGPSGGMSVNIRCPKCGQGINFLILPGCKGVDALDWCDNIGISESWISPHAKTITIEQETEIPRKLKWFGFPLGWLLGMTLQLVIFTLINHHITLAWWIVQLCGLFAVTFLWVVLDWKAIKQIKLEEKYKSITKWFDVQYESFVKWLNT